jgi:hypothetical protein
MVREAQDAGVLPPPYQMAGANHVQVGVVWDAAAVRKSLPREIKPTSDMTGGINIYQVEKGYVIGPYQAAYLWLDIEGYDSPEGIKGRWMLAGIYGPQAKTSNALIAYYGVPVRLGTSRIETTTEGKRAVGTLDGQDIVTVDIKSVPGTGEEVAALLNYVSISPITKGISVLKIPVVGQSFSAEARSVSITAPSGDPFAEYSITKTLWAAEFRNCSFSFSYPQPPRV